MLNVSRWILRITNVLNWGGGIATLLALGVIGYATPDLMTDALAQTNPAMDPGPVIVWLRWIVVILAPVIVLAHILFTRLIAMVDSVPLGEALSTANADRLQTIAWALIGINLLDLAYGAVTLWADAQGPTSNDMFQWTFGLTGWLAALMLFILAGVFREGAAMRAELEGTV